MTKLDDNKKAAEPNIVSETVRHGLEEDNLNKLARQIGKQLAQESRSPALIIGSCRISEIFLIFIIGLATHIWWYQNETSLLNHIPIMAFVALLSGLFLHISAQYTSYSLKRGLRTAPNVFMILISIFGIIHLACVTLGVANHDTNNWLSIWFVAAVATIILMRMCFSFAIAKWDRNGFMERRAILVGGGNPAEELIRKLEADSNGDIRICGIFDDRNDSRSHPIIAGYPKLGQVKDVIAFTRRTKIDLIIITLPLYAEERWVSMLKYLWVLPVDIRLAAHTSSLSFKPRFYSYEDQSNVPMLALFDKPISDWDSVSKRLFDLLFAAIALFALWPIMLATSIAIKLESKGPVIFKQKRHGINNEEIMVYKFRSMYHEKRDEKAVKMVTRDDDRVTRVGRFIRKTSIDELPQLFNVFKGQLSLVGPRPHAVTAQTKDQYFAEIADGYFARHRVKPGMTGWAQVNGLRGEITSDQKLKMRTEYDLYYIENWSLWFDFVILVKTPLSLFNLENAY